MKVIIPVAGIGTRLRPQTHTQPKALVPVAGKPILSHIVDNLNDGGVCEFVFIIGYLGDKIESFIKAKYPNISAHFVVQNHKEGIGHAVWLAKDLVEQDEPIMIVLGDTIFTIDMPAILTEKGSQLGVRKVNDPREFGVVELNEKGVVIKAVEKPSMPKSNLALVGIYKFENGRDIMESLDFIIQKNKRTYGEFQLTDALERMIEMGHTFTTFQVNDWYDCGKKEVLLATNKMLLTRNKQLQTSKKFENTVIIQPVSIGENCVVSNSIIGPNVSIGENSEIKNSILEDSIIGSYTHLHNMMLKTSLIGSDTVLRGASQSLNLGDSTEISFS